MIKGTQLIKLSQLLEEAKETDFSKIISFDTFFIYYAIFSTKLIEIFVLKKNEFSLIAIWIFFFEILDMINKFKIIL